MFCLALYIISVPLYVLAAYPLQLLQLFLFSLSFFSFPMCFFCFCDIFSPCSLLFFIRGGALWLLITVPCLGALARNYHQDIQRERYMEIVNFTLH